ncbi:TlpA disulfide reductase family protein [Marinilabilia rubra]|uniref:Alkyl hydroperoxide reductase n=1 Tax=Marinilabilia rubra TaxID=2162893 RepID=A0A2U2B692_9BACT|nr:TlpA disulfide reductase family protein [Marinilabilia rubra]PWD98588.1 alkyl hydroperoxide reductase [Marinilabilia rubra]
MRKFAFLFLICVAMLTSCGKNNQYKVSGNLDGVSEGEAVLQKIETAGPVAVDTAEIVDGSFNFSGTVEHPELYLIYVNDNKMPIAFFLEQGEISISANVENMQEAEVQGAALNAKFNEFNDSIPSNDRAQNLQQEFMAARQSGDQEKMQQLAAEYQGIMQKQQDYYRDFVFDNTDNAVGAFLAMNMANSLEVAKLEELVASFEESIPGHPYLQQIKDMLEPKQKQEAAETAIQVGKEAPGFTLTDMDGNEISLGDFEGKYVLLDFWASWCKPCRNENPNMVKAYKQFGGENFEIVGVSLDKTSEPWLKAVEEDNITWTQVHDPDGDVANTYGVQSIPFTLLLDKEGVIVEMNLRGEALQTKLEEVL